MSSIFIATPSYHVPVSHYYSSILGTIPALEADGHSVMWKEWEQCCYVHTARNKLCREFLFSGCEYLLFIDNDIGWEPAEMVNMCRREPNIVGAAAPFRHGSLGFPAHVLTDSTGRPRVDATSGLIEVDVLPTAIMRISRSALTQIADAGKAPLRIEYNRNEDEHTRYLSFFDFEIDDKRHLEFGEDVTFCRKWQSVGGSLWVDPDMTITHHGPDHRVGNLHEHLRALPGGGGEQPVEWKFRARA